MVNVAPDGNGHGRLLALGNDDGQHERNAHGARRLRHGRHGRNAWNGRRFDASPDASNASAAKNGSRYGQYGPRHEYAAGYESMSRAASTTTRRRAARGARTCNVD